ncbi:Uncharacterized protein PBTT_03656 [Plasmodiophora brassicae]
MRAAEEIAQDLRAVLGADVEAQFESDDGSLAILGEALRWAKARIELNAIIEANLDAERARPSPMHRVVQRMDVALEDCKELDQLASIAQRLWLKDGHPGSFVSALCDLQLEMADLQDKLAQLETYEANVQRRISEGIVPILSILERFSAEISGGLQANEERLRALQSERDFYLPAKQQEYESVTEQCNADLKETGYSSRISHSSLYELKTTLDELRSKTQPFSDRIEGYQNLPPDLSLAQEQLSRARYELDVLRSQWNASLSQIESVFDL